MSRDPATVIPLLLAFAAVLLWWHAAVRSLDRARDVARDLCARHGWQLLDQTVTLRSIRITRGARGLCLTRRYHFEFSADRLSRMPGGVSTRAGRPIELWADGPDGRIIETIDPGVGSS